MSDPPDDEPRDPFLDEDAPTPWHHVLRKGEMVFLGLAELDNIYDVAKALRNMPEGDLKSIVIERLYMWHASRDAGVLAVDDWLSPRDS